MTTSLIIFIVSVCGMIMMILLRLFELKTGRLIISEKFRDMTDRKIIIFWNRVSAYKHHKEYQLNHFFELVPVFLARLLYLFLKWVEKKGNRFFNMIKGKGVLTNRGSASFFLNNINKDKEDIK